MNKSLRTHFYRRDQLNKAWSSYIWAETNDARPAKPLTSVKLSITRYSHRMLDYDGLVGSLKPVVDALVTCRILKDDSWNVTGVWDVDQKFRKKSEGQLLEIRINEQRAAN